MPLDSISELMKVAPPPVTKNGTGTPEQWAQLEREYGLVFPEAFKQLVATYGSGRFTDFFGVANPFYIPPGDIGFREFVHLRTRDMAAAKGAYPNDAVALAVYPEKGGLFPWGYTDNGDTICWLTEGDSAHWPVICLERGYLKDYDRFDLTIVEFIEKWLTGKIQVPTLTPPDFFPLREPVFMPD